MHGAIAAVASIATIVFTVASMLSVGLSFTVAELAGPLREIRRVAVALVVNFVLVPALAIVVIRLFGLAPARGLGVFLVGAAAGAPFVIKLVSAANGPVARTATLLVLLVVGTVAYLPIVVPYALTHPSWTGIARAPVAPLAIAVPLIVTVLAPMAVGLAIRAGAARFAVRAQPHLGRTASIALIVLVIATVLANLPAIAGVLASATAPAIAVVIVGAFVIGFALGSDHERRIVLGLGSGQRNIAAAMIVAVESIGDADTISVVVTAAVLGLAVLYAIARLLRRHQRARPQQPPLEHWGEHWGTPLAE